MLPELIGQLRSTISAIEDKQRASPESVINTYLARFKRAVECLEKPEDLASIEKSLKRLKGQTHGYLETSSNHNQAFLLEMGKSESMTLTMNRHENLRRRDVAV